MTELEGSMSGGCPYRTGATGVSGSTSYGSGPTGLSSSDLTYNDYLKIPNLLSLQKPQSSPPHHDELLFIIIHQSYELWFKLILHEFESALHFMNEGAALRARHFVHRSVQIMKLLVQQIHILETMSPVEFLHFRDHLKPASGFQSTQFREIEFTLGLKDEKILKYFENRPEFLERLNARMNAPDLWTVFCQMLEKMGLSGTLEGMVEIYQDPEKHYPVFLLSEAMIELDEYLGFWRDHHVRVVERVIGAKDGTGGSDGVGYLRTTTSKKCFPILWKVRTELKKVP